MGFEWDEEKRLSNIAERGVDFRYVQRIFENPVIEANNGCDDYGERRVRALGYVDNEYDLVAYTWRGKNRWIVSAWKVGENGKARYKAILSEGVKGDGSAW